MTTSSRPGCIIVGGGIAGIAAAITLARRSVRVLLLETRKKLGGRATSFVDARSGHTVDNCQHVALGCCTNYLRLCELLGVADKLAWHDDIHWFESGRGGGGAAGRHSVLRGAHLPAPGHGGPSLLTARFLSLADKLALARAMTAAMFTDRSRHAGITFAQWLESTRPTPASVARFWSPLMVSACNLEVDRVCAATALHVVQEGFLANRVGSRMAVAAVPLVELYDPAEAIIAAAGGEIRLGASVSAIGERAVTLADGLVISADRVISAVPAERAIRMVDADLQQRDDRLARLAPHLTHSPILGVHLVFDRPVMRTPNAVLVDRATQWLFRKDDGPDGGRIVHAVISAADDWMPLPEPEIVERVVADIRACIPAASSAQVVSARAVKEKLATYAATPAFEAHRPATASDASRLILAGDYVRTGWPATMEGATRSGFQAAAAALGEPAESFVVPATRPGVVIRAIGARGLRDQHLVSVR
jgi:zeta-carotene desaturase